MANKPQEWFIIDWDDASFAPTRAATHLEPRNHCSRVFQDGHAGEVDVWAVGRLMKERLLIFDMQPGDFVFGNLRELAMQMMEGSLTAADALAEIRRIKQSLLNN